MLEIFDFDHDGLGGVIEQFDGDVFETETFESDEGEFLASGFRNGEFQFHGISCFR